MKVNTSESEMAREYVIRNYLSLEEKYFGDYIAVTNKGKGFEVVDNDSDQFVFARRLKKQKELDNKFVLITSLDLVINPKENVIEELKP